MRLGDCRKDSFAVKCAFFRIGLFFACAASFGADLPTSCAQALRRALSARAAWTMERRLAGAECTLVSTGEVVCASGEGIVWRVLHPFPSSVTMTATSMIFADEDGVRSKPLADLPHYGEIRARTDAFARGDTAAFDGLFSVEAHSGSNGWRLVFTPEVRAMRRLFSSIEVTGGAELSESILKTGDGCITRISFKELPRAR